MSFEIGQKVTNKNGAWVILRNDPSAGQYYEGVWHVEHWAPDFLGEQKPARMCFTRDRKRAERACRTWLAKR